MSEFNSSSSNSEQVEEIMFQCRKCGQQFDAGERDAHRQEHRRERDARRVRSRPGDDTRSEGTMFDRVPKNPKPQTAQKKPGPKSRKNKRKSVKKYDHGVPRTRNSSG